MNVGKLTFTSVQIDDQRVPHTVSKRAYESGISDQAFIAKIDPDFADTASFCDYYQIDQKKSVNCIVIEAKRAGQKWYCACLIMATDIIDVNGKVRKALGASKTSFAAKEIAVELSGMQYGGITPIGLPDDWLIYVDESVTNQEFVVIGGGFRESKIAVKSNALIQLPNVMVIDIKKG